LRLGVAGWPVAHSRSPVMQNAALHALGLGDWRYQLLPLPPALFDQTVAALPANGFRGINVTIPYKQAALALADAASAAATATGAANTLLLQPDGTVVADNTDAPALRAAIAERLPLPGLSVFVLGAGGSARAAVWALTAAGADVHVWNRTASRAADLCAAIGGRPLAGLAAVATLRSVDLIVNCTSVGLRPEDELSALPLSPRLLGGARLVVDLVYGKHETPLIAAARAAGVETLGGLEILVRQGALALELFTGRKAPLAVMRAAVGL
jgi:shikimate dehydrogenase